MDDEPGVVASFKNLRNDLIEWNDFGLDVGGKEFQDKIRVRQRSWNRDLLVLNLLGGVLLVGHDHRAVTLADASTISQQSVLFLEIWIRVKRDGRKVVKPF